VHGLRSVRLHTPAAGKGLMFIAYPVEAATLHPGRSFSLSLWARGVGLQGAQPRLRFGCPYYLSYGWEAEEKRCSAPECYRKTVALTDEWARFEMRVTSHGHFSGDASWLFVELVDAGVALVDLLQLVPVQEL